MQKIYTAVSPRDSGQRTFSLSRRRSYRVSSPCRSKACCPYPSNPRRLRTHGKALEIAVFKQGLVLTNCGMILPRVTFAASREKARKKYEREIVSLVHTPLSQVSAHRCCCTPVDLAMITLVELKSRLSALTKAQQSYQRGRSTSRASSSRRLTISATAFHHRQMKKTK